MTTPDKPTKRRRERDLSLLLTLPRETPITLSEVAIIASVSLRHIMAERSLGRGPRTYNLGDKCLRSTVGDALSWVNSRAEVAR
jgi:hypothetical protein